VPALPRERWSEQEGRLERLGQNQAVNTLRQEIHEPEIKPQIQARNFRLESQAFRLIVAGTLQDADTPLNCSRHSTLLTHSLTLLRQAKNKDRDTQQSAREFF
jgi:hypothetical protein